MKKIVSYILFVGAAVALLWFSFRGVKWVDFKEGMKSTNYYWILFSMVLGALSFWVRAMRWRVLIGGTGYSVGRGSAFDAVNIAYLTNFAIPRAGEVARCGVLTKKEGVPFETLLGTVVLERVFDLLCLFVVTALVVVLQWSVFGLFMEQQIWIPLVEVFNGNLFYLLLVFFVCFLTIFLVFAFKKRLQKVVFFKKLFDFTNGLARGLKSGFTMKQKAPFFGYTLLLWILYWAMCQTTMLAFPAVAHLSWLDAMFLMAVGSLGWAVPVQGGIGAYHFIVSLALASVYGIGQTQGLVFATISHEAQALIMIVFGLYSFIRIALCKKNNYIGNST